MSLWDFDNGDGVAEDALDFQTIAIQAIGHILGFFSNIDNLDVVAGNNYFFGGHCPPYFIPNP